MYFLFLFIGSRSLLLTNFSFLSSRVRIKISKYSFFAKSSVLYLLIRVSLSQVDVPWLTDERSTTTSLQEYRGLTREGSFEGISSTDNGGSFICAVPASGDASRRDRFCLKIRFLWHFPDVFDTHVFDCWQWHAQRSPTHVNEGLALQASCSELIFTRLCDKLKSSLGSSLQSSVSASKNSFRSRRCLSLWGVEFAGPPDSFNVVVSAHESRSLSSARWCGSFWDPTNSRHIAQFSLGRIICTRLNSSKEAVTCLQVTGVVVVCAGFMSVKVTRILCSIFVISFDICRWIWSWCVISDFPSSPIFHFNVSTTSARRRRRGRVQRHVTRVVLGWMWSDGTASQGRIKEYLTRD